MKPEFGPSPIDLLNQQFRDNPKKERPISPSTLAHLLHVGRPKLTRIVKSNTLQIDPQNPKQFIITGEKLATLQECVNKGITR